MESMQRHWRGTSILRATTVAVALSGSLAAAASASSPLWAESFGHLDGWSAHPADGVQMSLHLEASDPADHAALSDSSLRIDFSFGGAGWAIARRTVELELPPNYEFSFLLRGATSFQTLEFKLVDSSGENVWWAVRRDFEFPADWQRFVVQRRHISFAWGPLGGGEPGTLAAIEIAITAGSGGSGSVWIDDLSLRELPPPDLNPPVPLATASSSAPGSDPAHVIDDEPSSSWSPASDDQEPWLKLDLRSWRELSGLVLDWGDRAAPASYQVEISDDGERWEPRQRVVGSNGGRDWLHLPDTDARALRVRWSPEGQDVALADLALQPLDWAPGREDFFREIARDSPRGVFPRGISGEQVYWTVVGIDGDEHECLLSEDGAIELTPWGPSLEPFIQVDGELWTWADVEHRCGLEDGTSALPWVSWSKDGLSLEIRAVAIGEPGSSSICMRYRLHNQSRRALQPGLHLAIRPFQVNPPSQVLNRPGGVARIRRMNIRGDIVEIDGRIALRFLDPPRQRGVSTFHAGDVVSDHLRDGPEDAASPLASSVEDPFEAASGLISYEFSLDADATAEVAVIIPLHTGSDLGPTDLARARAWLDRSVEQSRRGWDRLLDRFRLELPPSAAWIERTLHSQIGYLRVQRDGPAIQPGSRSYARSWIRDGALSSSALLRTGHGEVARAFLEWYAPHQFANGKIPCVVDARGADPVPEHDSAGEFIFLVAESFRYLDDRALAERMWPRVQAAAAYLDSLRQLRRTEPYREAQNLEFFGLLPESISHEGYSAKPMHSYWDDFWALRGFADAAWLASALGQVEAQARWEAIHSEFSADLRQSIDRSMRGHEVDYVPGCAELGDFDPTSTTIALTPTRAAAILDPAALQNTFERYWGFFVDRRDGASWEVYTPYELRNVGAFVRLGWTERAHELLEWFRQHQRPAGWNHWAEVVASNARQPRFLGDMPHTWVGTDFVRSMLDMLAYEPAIADGALVLAAGVPTAWIEEDPGLSVRGLLTPFGRLDMRMRVVGDAIRVELGDELQPPPNGLWLVLPPGEPTSRITVDGQPAQCAQDAPLSPGREALRLWAVPTVVEIRR